MAILDLSSFFLLWVKFLWALFYKSFGRFLKLHLGVDLLGHKVGVCLKLGETVRQFSNGAVPVYTSASQGM